jgi:hypothetical protein
LKKKIELLGGIVQKRFSDKTTHVITPDTNFDSFSAVKNAKKANKENSRKIKILKKSEFSIYIKGIKSPPARKRNMTCSSVKDKILAKILKSMHKQVVADLTIGRSDNDLKQWSKKQISRYIDENKSNLDNAVQDMFELLKELDAENNENEINNENCKWEDDWIREVLYEYLPDLVEIQTK